MITVLVSKTNAAGNETDVDKPKGDPFEEDEDLRLWADTYCREKALASPMLKIVIPYHSNCHFWWQCSAYELRKMECQGLTNTHRITLHYDVYLDRCELPDTAKCNYIYGEEESIMAAIMSYKEDPPQ